MNEETSSNLIQRRSSRKLLVAINDPLSAAKLVDNSVAERIMRNRVIQSGHIYDFRSHTLCGTSLCKGRIINLYVRGE
jgi:hypothetical protein